MMNKAKQIQTAERGCYIEGSWGQYAFGRLCVLAESFGWKNEYMITESSINDFDLDFLIEIADNAEQWLNDNAAPKDHSFGWFDGEFYLWPDQEWQMVGF
jgi:hypothetical protein